MSLSVKPVINERPFIIMAYSTDVHGVPRPRKPSSCPFSNSDEAVCLIHVERWRVRICGISFRLAGVVILYFTGLHHAGEILDLLIKHRDSNGPKLPKVTDGASKNFNPLKEDLLIEGVCNAHALLKFDAVKTQYAEEYAVAGAVYKQVFDNDDIAKNREMTPEERMAFHAENSLPLMKTLKKMCAAKVVSRLVEPNSKLWEPLTFIINQWPRLTKFCHEPGVPLDTNLVEQILIIPVRYLGGSFNYQTSNGAEVGDHFMSLVVTAKKNDVEPVAYIEHCLRNHEDLKKRPEYYFLWVYRDLQNALPKPPDSLH